MRKYSMPFGRSIDYQHPYPERTAYKSGPGTFSDLTFQVWSNRKAMARSIRMQQRRTPRADDWRPVVKLETTEGY